MSESRGLVRIKRNWGLVLLLVSAGNAVLWCACAITAVALGKPGDFVLAALGFAGGATLLCVMDIVMYGLWKRLPDSIEECARDYRAEALWWLAKGKMLSSLSAFPRSRLGNKEALPEIGQAVQTGYRVAIIMSTVVFVISTGAIALLVVGTVVTILERL